MKLAIMFAASAMSAGLVLPTVSQGQSSSIQEQTAAAVSQPERLEQQT